MRWRDHVLGSVLALGLTGAAGAQPVVTGEAPAAGLRPGINTLQGVPVVSIGSGTTVPGTIGVTPSPAAVPPDTGAGIPGVKPSSSPGTISVGSGVTVQGDIAATTATTGQVTPAASMQPQSLLDGSTMLDPSSIAFLVRTMNADAAATANARTLTTQLRTQRLLGSDEQIIGTLNGRAVKVKRSLMPAAAR